MGRDSIAFLLILVRSRSVRIVYNLESIVRKNTKRVRTSLTQRRTGVATNMPMYEYLCDSCHHRFDIKQKFTDETLTICPSCGKHIHRVIQPAKVVFKGSGFYITDHKGGGSSAVLDSGKTETKSGNGAETKPDTDKTAKTETAAASSGSSSESTGSNTSAPVAAPTSASTQASN